METRDRQESAGGSSTPAHAYIPSRFYFVSTLRNNIVNSASYGVLLFVGEDEFALVVCRYGRMLFFFFGVADRRCMWSLALGGMYAAVVTTAHLDRQENH